MNSSLRFLGEVTAGKFCFKIYCRECVRAGAAGSQTRRFLGHHLLQPLILRLLVLCAPAVLRPRALQDAPAPADPNSQCIPCTDLYTQNENHDW